ncbi:MAG: hypothetical protein CMP12_11390 [Zunongwangia sp.]|uniref:hypothetical protein n=1 Tax=Zunongwangia profunda TaxID=398743 RepID=UPI000C93063D|nr:hypothetical protein [Zunongwangia profunda]MAO36487.1 hypothetical protein [Zunongwangia sp.]|tara:strand:+ start:27308 stop:30604 length:3297 start_codon:yes stop_codon:yes gene_type:complete
MQNNYPRIYSLSTIGIKQHFNADYLFHPYRTDFSGESGSGKSMIADMIQLVLVGSSEFKSATEGNKQRDIKGMLITKKGHSSSRGYIFLNIEVSPKKYFVIGAYIEGISNAAEMFIIQNGYDWDNLIPLNKPVFNKDLLIDNKVDILKNLCERIESTRMKSYRRKNYHQILYDNAILSLDLTKDETLKTYANIIRSFSRGKGFKTESEDLKKFLFGDDEKNAIIEKYNEEVENISNDFHEHKRYSQEIELINDKQVLLKTVLEKQKNYKSIYKGYLIKKYSYWNTFKKKTTTEKLKMIEVLNFQKNDLQFVENDLLKLKIEDLKELVNTKKKVDELTKKDNSKNDIETKFLNIGNTKLQIEVAEKWLTSHNNDIKKVNQWFVSQKLENNNKSALLEFTKYLSINNIIDSFKASHWFTDYQNENKEYQKKIKELEKDITELQSLSRFSDLNNPESLVNWAIDNLEFPLSHNLESILIYFQKYGKVKPFDGNPNRYVPFPEQLFQDIGSNIKDKSKDGFWLNLDGVYEFIRYSEHLVLNVEDPNDIIESLSKLKEGVEEKLSKLIAKKKNIEYLKDKLFEYSNLEKHIGLFKRKDELLSFKIDDSLKDITEDSFKIHMQAHKNKTKILEQYRVLQKEFEEYSNRKSLLESYKKRIKQLESDLFKDDNFLDAKLIKGRITSEEQNLAVKEKKLKEQNFDEKLFFKSHTKYSINQKNLSELKHQLLSAIKDIDKEIEKKEEQLNLAQDEIEQTKELNEQLFHTAIEFDENNEEVVNPDDGGSNSFQYKANKAQLAYIEYLKIITKDLPYDETASIGQLANFLLPTVFPSTKVDEDLIENDIVERLSKLTHDIQEIGSRKVEILGSIFNEVYKIYSGYLTKINDIDNYLKKGNRGITGGNKASLTFKKSIHYPENWLTTFRKQLHNQLSYTGLFSELREEIDINEMMIKAFQKLGGSTKVEPEDLMNPKSYFDLVFELKLENEEVNSGSNGQTYAANALLCLARLSLIEEEDKKGLKIMPIDEAEGLGSNYDMLHELAKKEKYQIITMAIETAGEITDSGQYIYIMNENNLANVDSFVPPLGIFSEEITEDIEQYIQSLSDYE